MAPLQARVVASIAVAGSLLGGPARAVDIFEIQVYQGDINDAGQAGVELHTNFVARGRATAEFDGEEIPDRSLRFTLEPSYGVLPFWELGAYLQLETAPSRGRAQFGGFKLRSKFVLPRGRTGPFILGLNLEVGRGVAALGTLGWDSEVRPIIAWERGRWFVAVNPILGWALSGDASAAPAFEPCAKVRFDTHRRVAVGLEYYAGLGRLTDLPAPRQQQHVVYLAGDLLGGPIELNVGLGRGLSAVTDAWTLKVIVGKTF